MDRKSEKEREQRTENSSTTTVKNSSARGDFSQGIQHGCLLPKSTHASFKKNRLQIRRMLTGFSETEKQAYGESKNRPVAGGTAAIQQ